MSGHVRQFIMVSIITHKITRFGSQLYRHIVGIPVCSNCVSIAADFSLLMVL